MNIPLVILGTLTLVSAALAMVQRKVITTALLLVVTWLGIAGIYLWASAEFTAFAQVIVYVGAISMIVLFAVLLTNRGENLELFPETKESRWRVVAGVLISSAVAGILSGAVLAQPAPTGSVPANGSVQALGQHLGLVAADAVLVVAALLTVALVGAAVIARSRSSKEASAT